MISSREVSLSFLYELSEFTDIFQRNYGPFLVLARIIWLSQTMMSIFMCTYDSHRVLENKTE